MFSAQGEVISAKVIKWTDGKSRGFGFVEMTTEDEAKQAIEKMNQSTVKDRVLVVSEAKETERSNFNRDTSRRRSYSSDSSKDDLNSKLRQLKRKFK